jgi:hypothetical protein
MSKGTGVKTRGFSREKKPPVLLSVDTSAVENMLATLGQDIEESIRYVAQAGAQVFYDEVKKNVSQIKPKTGNLNNAIYQKFIPEESVDGKRAVYRISWNIMKAPHGGLVEWGHLIRYKYSQDDAGNIRPMVRPEMIGKPRPKKSASRAEKDAYYVKLPNEIQVPGKAFVRRALDRQPQAIAAMEIKLFKVINGMFS